MADPIDESMVVANQNGSEGLPMVINSAEVDVQISTALRYPRSIRTFKEKATEMATIDVETAASCMFTLPRAGKPITGPSVRLAEICASAWKNIRVEGRVVGETDKEIISEATCWDLENNVAVRIQNRRRITTKTGQRFSDDMITVTGNAAVSIALRNAIFRVIPKAFVNEIYQNARRVAIGDASTLAETRTKIVDYFGKMGVTPERICSTLERPSVEDIGLDDIAVLRGYATAIRENQIAVDEAFPLITPAQARDAQAMGGMAGLKDRLTQQPEGAGATEAPSNTGASEVVGAPATPTGSAAESSAGEEPAKQEPAISKKRADLLAALDEVDQEALAIALEGNELSTLSDGQLKDLYRDLSKK